MKSKLPLMMAVIIGVLALIAVRSYVAKMQEQTQAQLKGDLMVAAARDIPKGTEFKKEMLKLTPVPRKFITNRALKGEGEAMELIGRKALYLIPANQIISWSDVQMDETEGLSDKIQEGQRGFTISIARGLKPSMVRVGDHIDIIGSFAAPKPAQPMPATVATWRQSSDMVNLVLLQNVTILAVGDFLGTSSGSRVENSGGMDLTLALKLPEAQMLMFASEHGELGAVLRHWESTEFLETTNLPRITFESLERLIGDLDGKRSYRIVPVESGPKTIQVPVNNPP